MGKSIERDLTSALHGTYMFVHLHTWQQSWFRTWTWNISWQFWRSNLIIFLSWGICLLILSFRFFCFYFGRTESNFLSFFLRSSISWKWGKVVVIWLLQGLTIWISASAKCIGVGGKWPEGHQPAAAGRRRHFFCYFWAQIHGYEYFLRSRIFWTLFLDFPCVHTSPWFFSDF